MSINSVFTLGVVATSAGQVNQITTRSINPGLETMVERSDGQVDPTFAAVMTQAPTVTFDTTAVARALAYIGLSGLAITGAGTPTDLWFQRIAKHGTRMTGSSSTKFTVAEGIIVPTKLEASAKAFASVGYSVHACSTDGAASPLAVTNNAAMPTIVSTREYFTVGPASINGTAIENASSFSFDPGIEVQVLHDGGAAYPTFSFIQARKPTITIKTTNLAIITTLGFYAGQNATDSVFYLQKCQQNGMRIANGTAEHIKLTIDDGLMTVGEVGGDDGPAELEIKIEPTFDGVNDVVALNLASTIT